MTKKNKQSTPTNKRIYDTCQKSQIYGTCDVASSISHNDSEYKCLRNDTCVVRVIIEEYNDLYNKPNVIFLNPETIFSTTFNFFGYTILSYHHKQVVCVIYPDQTVNKDRVRISDFVSNSLQVDQDAVVTLSHVKYKIQIADKLVLQYNCTTKLRIDDPLFEYTSHQLEGMVLCVDDEINMTFQNNMYTVKVVNLLGSKNYDALNCTIGSNLSKDSLNELDITSLMDDLRLFKSNESNNCLSASYNNNNNNNLSTSKYGQNYGLIVKKKTTEIVYVSMYDNYTTKNSSMGTNDVQIYGHGTILNTLRDTILLPLKSTNVTKKFGLMVPYGVLIHGHRGCGKTTIIKQLCSQSDVISLWVDLMTIKREYEDPNKYLSELFCELKLTKNPTIVVIDDCDNYFPSEGKEMMNEEFMELCQLLLSLLIELRKTVVESKDIPISIIGSCNEISRLYPGLYQNGIFDIEYEISVPTSDERYWMLKGILSNVDHKLEENQIKYLANHSNGYLPKDLILLTQLSGVNFLKRYHVNEMDVEGMKLSYNDFLKSLNEICPSVIKSFTTDIPKIRWDDIGGMEQVKCHLRECILWPILYPQSLANMGIESFGGVLLYGPPGCSKTMMARALAGESQMNFISIKGPELLNKYVGETEKTIRDLFKKARMAAPCILFFDEMDAIASQRDTSSSGHSDFNDRILAQFLTEIDGISGNNLNVFVVAATNRPFSIDSALMRPGRFDRLVYVPLPDSISRKSIFELQFKKIPIDASINMNCVVELTEGYSGAEIVALCKEAAYCALRDNIETKNVSIIHFERALINVRPRVTMSSLQMYSNFTNRDYKA